MARKHMIGIRKFFVFLKKYYNYTMKRFSNKKSKAFAWLGRGKITRDGRSKVIITGYILALLFIILPFFQKTIIYSEVFICTFMSWCCCVAFSATTKFGIIYYLFLYLYCYKKIDSEKYSLNERIIASTFLFEKPFEKIWAIINKIYKVNLKCSLFKTEFYLTMRKQTKKSDCKTLQITKKAIYFEGKKIFGKLYDINELDSFLEESVKEEGK